MSDLQSKLGEKLGSVKFITDVYTKEQADNVFLKKEGGTITGVLTLCPDSGTTAISADGDLEVTTGFAFRINQTTYEEGQIVYGSAILALPEESGTLATTSDIESALGDIATALAAITGVN